MPESVTPVIYKYKVAYFSDLKAVMHVPMHEGTILSVDAQGDYLCVWALVDPTTPITPRELRAYPTGEPCFESPANYVGSVPFAKSMLIFHIFMTGSLTNQSTLLP